MSRRRIVVCITGASGSVYARRTLELLTHHAASSGFEVHWVASPNAGLVWKQELAADLPESFPQARRWSATDFSAPFASGSNPPAGVVVVPCSMTTLSRVAHGGGSDLIARTCDVALKERRPLVLVARETPLSLVHLRNMVAATEAGAIVLPAVPSFYGSVTSIADAIDTVVSRALDRIGLDLPIAPRWGETHDDPT